MQLCVCLTYVLEVCVYVCVGWWGWGGVGGGGGVGGAGKWKSGS